MTIFNLLLIAIGLSMDAFAVSITSGMLLPKANWRKSMKIGGVFGVFQGVMPLIGYTIANVFARQIQTFDHWIAFVLLTFVGGKMLWGVWHDHADTPVENPDHWSTLFVMGIATSLDALAVGVSFAVMPHTGMLAPMLGYLGCFVLIAAVTFVISTLGVRLGAQTGAVFGKKAEILGGVILIAIGVKILLEHLLAG